MNTGQEFVKSIRPIGAALFLFLFVVVTVFMFTSGRDPIPGYKSPQGSSYYSQSSKTLEELKSELEANVFPRMNGFLSAEIAGSKLSVTIADADFDISSRILLTYYDEELFDLVRAPKITD